MESNNSEFNSAINAILRKATGRNIQDDIDAGSIDNLPVNFELVSDFQTEAYCVVHNDQRY